MTDVCAAFATYPGLISDRLAILYPKRFAVNLFRTLWLKVCTFRTKYLRTNANRPKFYAAGIWSTPWDLEHPTQSTLVPCTSYCFSHCNCFGRHPTRLAKNLPNLNHPQELEYPLGSRGGAGIWSTPQDLVVPLGSCCTPRISSDPQDLVTPQDLVDPLGSRDDFRYRQEKR